MEEFQSVIALVTAPYGAGWPSSSVGPSTGMTESMPGRPTGFDEPQIGGKNNGLAQRRWTDRVQATARYRGAGLFPAFS